MPCIHRTNGKITAPTRRPNGSEDLLFEDRPDKVACKKPRPAEARGSVEIRVI